MMRVIVDHRHAVLLAAHLEPARGSEERRGGLGCGLGCHAQQHRGQDGRGRVARVVHAWDGEADRQRQIGVAAAADRRE